MFCNSKTKSYVIVFVRYLTVYAVICVKINKSDGHPTQGIWLIPAGVAAPRQPGPYSSCCNKGAETGQKLMAHSRIDIPLVCYGYNLHG